MRMLIVEKSERYISDLRIYKRLKSEELEKYEEVYNTFYYRFLTDKNIDFILDSLIDKLNFIAFEKLDLFNLLSDEEKKKYLKLKAEEEFIF